MLYYICMTLSCRYIFVQQILYSTKCTRKTERKKVTSTTVETHGLYSMPRFSDFGGSLDDGWWGAEMKKHEVCQKDWRKGWKSHFFFGSSLKRCGDHLQILAGCGEFYISACCNDATVHAVHVCKHARANWILIPFLQYSCLVILPFSHFNEYGRKVTLGNRRTQFAESCAHLRLSAAWLMRMVVVWKGWFYASPHNVVILSYGVIPVYSIMTGIRHLLYLKILVFMILARTAWTDSSLGLKPIQRCLLLWTFE